MKSLTLSSLGVFKRHAAKSYRELFRVGAGATLSISRGHRLTCSVLEPRKPQHEDIAVPPQSFGSIASLVHEQEHSAISWVAAERDLCHFVIVVTTSRVVVVHAHQQNANNRSLASA
jgi:hypothetical protein